LHVLVEILYGNNRREEKGEKKVPSGKKKGREEKKSPSASSATNSLPSADWGGIKGGGGETFGKKGRRKGRTRSYVFALETSLFGLKTVERRRRKKAMHK